MANPIDLDMVLKIAGETVRLQIPNNLGKQTLWNSARHCNSVYEIHVILSGSCTLMVEEQPCQLDIPSAVLIPPGYFHYPVDLSPDFEWFTFSFTLDDGILSEQLLRIRKHILHRLSPATILLCRNILAEAISQESFRQDALSAMFTQFLIQILRSIQVKYDTQTSHTTDTAAVRAIIIDKFFAPWPNPFGTQEDLANLLHISRRQLNRILLQHYGVNFRMKLLQARMEQAGWLLRTTDKKISEVALLVGYTTGSSFYKTFQAYYHTTPQAYRKNNQ